MASNSNSSEESDDNDVEEKQENDNHDELLKNEKKESRRVSFTSHEEKKKKKSKRRHSVNTCQSRNQKKLILDLTGTIEPLHESEDEDWTNLPVPTMEERKQMKARERQLLEETFRTLNIVKEL